MKKNKKQAEKVWGKRFLAFSGVGCNVVGISLGFLLYRVTSPLIEASVLNGLLVAISIFIGFVSVIVIFYLGKMDEHEREFLRALNNVRIFEEEFFVAIPQLFSIVSSSEHKTRIEETAKEIMRTAFEHIQSNPVYTKEDRDRLLNNSREFRMLTIRWGVFSLIMYLAGLSYCILALLLINVTSEEDSNSVDPLISLSIGSLFYATLCVIVLNISMFTEFWYLGEGLMNIYRENMVKIQDYADSEIGKALIKFTKIMKDKQDESTNH